ncbi:MAG: nicotinamide riboside transporter PnuC [Sphingobacteriales bacterium]|nr:MAG: nicotinamide riboside transporter PnuC [Sphingobacteriales bacterium]
MTELLSQTRYELLHTPLIEWIAVLFGVAQVLLAKNNNVLLYPAGIISTALSIYILARVELYAESVLNAYYLVMSIYGWLHWLYGRKNEDLPITKASKHDWITTGVIVAVSWIILYLALQRYTNSDVPAMDAWVSATAWAGMWLLAKRKLENWILLNISNLFAIPLQLYKGIPLYGILTLVLFIVAIFGYFKWKNIYEEQRPKLEPQH